VALFKHLLTDEKSLRHVPRRTWIAGDQSEKPEAQKRSGSSREREREREITVGYKRRREAKEKLKT
jgi:hypothetical protein